MLASQIVYAWRRSIMARDLGLLRIDRLIAQDVPQRRASETAELTDLSDAECTLTVELRNFFRERIADSLKTAAYDVNLLSESESPMPQLITRQLAEREADFIELSCSAARHLYQCQDWNNPAGLLIIAQGTIEQVP